MNTLSTQPIAATHRPLSQKWSRSGKVRPGILLWALGVPIPLILLVLLIRGCM